MSNLLDSLSVLRSQQAYDHQQPVRDKLDALVQQYGNQFATLYRSPLFAGRFSPQYGTSESDGTIGNMLMRYGLEIGQRESNNVRDVTQSVSMNPLQAVRDLHATNALMRLLQQ